MRDYYLLLTRDDEFLGRATVQTSVVAERGHIEGMWVDLEECLSGKAKVRRNASLARLRFVIQEDFQSDKAKVCQSVGVPVWQGQGSLIGRNASLARPRFVNQKECQSGKAKVCQEEFQSGKTKVRQSGGMPVWQG